MSKFHWSLPFVLSVTIGFALCGATTYPASIPVIPDTDIGSDIDDTWAQGMLPACPNWI